MLILHQTHDHREFEPAVISRNLPQIIFSFFSNWFRPEGNRSFDQNCSNLFCCVSIRI